MSPESCALKLDKRSYCSVQDLTKEKEELTKERDTHLKQIVHVRLPQHTSYTYMQFHSINIQCHGILWRDCIDASEGY